jgi:hypothetical protein
MANPAETGESDAVMYAQAKHGLLPIPRTVGHCARVRWRGESGSLQWVAGLVLWSNAWQPVRLDT